MDDEKVIDEKADGNDKVHLVATACQLPRCRPIWDFGNFLSTGCQLMKGLEEAMSRKGYYQSLEERMPNSLCIVP